MRSTDARAVPRWLVAALVAVPVVFNAVALAPEVTTPVPSVNDDAFHSVMVRGADDAIATGENPVDHWQPDLELGFPQFFYYQHLPHLFVVALRKLTLSSVDALTMMNIVRYLLLVLFPVTVWWSMRRMGFSALAAAAAAAGSSLIAGNFRFGFEYDSYVWRGYGMYTQLWAMHLTFVVGASVWRLLRTGSGTASVALTFAALTLCHLVYAFMALIVIVVLCVAGLERATFRSRAGRLTLALAIAAILGSYLTIPFVLEHEYLSASQYLERWKYDSFGAPTILRWIGSGSFLDHGRLPVLTILTLGGAIAAVFVDPERKRLARAALLVFVVMLLLYFGRPLWGSLLEVLPLDDGLLFHRFSGAVHVGALLLVGVAADAVWDLLQRFPVRIAAAVGLGVVVLALVPMLRERASFYAANSRWIRETARAVEQDRDAAAVIARLRALPPARVYAGLRSGFSEEMKIAYVRFSDLLVHEGVTVAAAPYQSLSLAADMVWHFETERADHYDVFDARYVVAPASARMPEFLRPLLRAGRYTLYTAPGSGAGTFAAIDELRAAPDQRALFEANRAWLASGAPGMRSYIRWSYPSAREPAFSTRAGCDAGAIHAERVRPGAFRFDVECTNDTAFVLKSTFHPNWRATIDGEEVDTFMVSPGYLGVDLPLGRHVVEFTYRSPPLKTVFLVLGLLALVAVIVARDRLDASPHAPTEG